MRLSGLRSRGQARGRAGRSAERARLLLLARDGDPCALAALRADLSPAAVDALAALLLPAGDDSTVDEVVAACRSCGGDPLLLEAVVLVLLEDEGRSPSFTAELLDVPLDAVEQVRAASLTRAGRPVGPVACRGWMLVARADRLAGAERDAADAHAAACRSCRDAAGAVRQSLRPDVSGRVRPAGG